MWSCNSQREERESGVAVPGSDCESEISVQNVPKHKNYRKHECREGIRFYHEHLIVWPSTNYRPFSVGLKVCF